jgi:hypothetical protein
MRPISLLFALALAAPVVACSFNAESGAGSTPAPETYSSAVPTSDMWPSMSAQTQGGTVTVYAAVLQSGGSFLTLSDGDYFSAAVGDHAGLLAMEPGTPPGVVHYTANFPAPADSASVISGLIRAGSNASAPSTQLVLAAPFEITSAPPASFKYGTTLAITIAPASTPPPVTLSDYWSMDIIGPCMADNHEPSVIAAPASDGTILFDTSQIPMKQAEPGCAVSVQVRHETRGTGDPAYHSGADVEGLQARLFATELTL